MSLLLRGVLCTISPSAVTASTASMDRHAGAKSARVPAVAPAEQEPGEADVRAVADREEQPVRYQRLVHVGADHPGLHGDSVSGWVHGDLAQPGQVEQQAAVVQVPAAPAVPAGAQRDLEALGAGVPDRRGCVILGDRDHDEIGVPGGLRAFHTASSRACS